MSTVRVTADGRITIPVELRRKLKLRPGTRLSVREENGHLVLISLKRLLDKIQGSLRPHPGEPSMFDELLRERKRERIREETRANS